MVNWIPVSYVSQLVIQSSLLMLIQRLKRGFHHQPKWDFCPSLRSFATGYMVIFRQKTTGFTKVLPIHGWG